MKLINSAKFRSILKYLNVILTLGAFGLVIYSLIARDYSSTSGMQISIMIMILFSLVCALLSSLFLSKNNASLYFHIFLGLFLLTLLVDNIHLLSMHSSKHVVNVFSLLSLGLLSVLTISIDITAKKSLLFGTFIFISQLVVTIVIGCQGVSFVLFIPTIAKLVLSIVLCSSIVVKYGDKSSQKI